MGAIKILPDHDYIIEDRQEINEKFMLKISSNRDIELVERLVSHHIAMDAHIDLLESMIIDLQGRFLSLKKSYDELLNEYEKISNQEIKNLKWILKQSRKNLKSKKAE